MVEWKIVEGHDCYMVSNEGEVRKVKQPVYVNGEWTLTDVDEPVNIMKDGGVYLGKGNKPYIHRLVAIHFLPNPSNHKYVKFKDGDKNNVRFDNLYWDDVKRAFKIGMSETTITNYETRKEIVVDYRMDGIKHEKSFRYARCGFEQAMEKANQYIEDVKTRYS